MSEFPKISISLVKKILLRLPVKSVLRFRLVSKSLCAEIDSPNFVKQFLDYSLKTSPDFDIVISKGPMLYSVRFPHVDDLTTAEAIELDYPFKDPSSDVLAVGSCNGILCLEKMGTHRFFILWNRAIGKYRKVEPPNSLVSRNYASYFGFDQAKDDYNVVIISVKEHSYAIEVYSLKTDSWTRINQAFPYRTCFLDSGVFIHGAVHWLASEKPFARFLEPEVIVAFDVGTATFRQIPKPNRRGHDCAMMGLYDLGGHLCLVSSEVDNGFPFLSYMWVMENYGVEEWTPLLPVKTEQTGFRPFAYYPQGSKQVLGILGSTLKWCFPKESRLVNVSVRGLPYRQSDPSDSDSDLSDSDGDQPDWDSITFTGCTCFESLVPI